MKTERKIEFIVLVIVNKSNSKTSVGKTYLFSYSKGYLIANKKKASKDCSNSCRAEKKSLAQSFFSGIV
jgi:hypothetical protein